MQFMAALFDGVRRLVAELVGCVPMQIEGCAG
jgi:hypothetical protein